MSADNWAVCPNCGGKSATDFKNTLREDYEIYIERGKFHVHYQANCTIRLGGCGWSFQFQTVEPVPVSA